MVHFRLLTDTNFLPYGRSYIEPARKSFKQMVLMEDAMLVHRIVRAPEKRIFYVNVGSIPPNEIDNFMENVGLDEFLLNINSRIKISNQNNFLTF